jgi:hypothetical protein
MTRNLASSLTIAATAAAIASMAIIAAGDARADDITLDSAAFVSNRTRADVVAETLDARRTSTTEWTLQQNQPVTMEHVAASAAPLTREQVRADYGEARFISATFYAEDSGSSALWKMRAPAADSRTLGGPAH